MFRDLEKQLHLKRVPEFSPKFAEDLRDSALIVLSTNLKSSRDVVRPGRKFQYGRSVSQILGYDTMTLPHLTVLKTALGGEVSPTLPQPDWLRGYALRPFPHEDGLKVHEPIVVAGIRELGDIRELYYGSHPDSAAINPKTGVITPDASDERRAVGVLSSPLNPASQTKLRFWYSPYVISPEEWPVLIAQDERVLRHLYYEGTQNYDGFTRQSFSVDKNDLMREARTGSETAIISTMNPSFGMVELCKVQIGKDQWFVYASGPVRATASVFEKLPKRVPQFEATATASMAAAEIR